MSRYWIPIGAVNLFFSVALGAFGAHSLQARLSSEMLSVFQTGVHYQTTHGLALILVGAIFGEKEAIWPGRFFFFGIILFSGSLYGLSIFENKALGIITPFGGLSFLLGWLAFAKLTWKRNKPHPTVQS